MTVIRDDYSSKGHYGSWSVECEEKRFRANAQTARDKEKKRRGEGDILPEERAHLAKVQPMSARPERPLFH